MLGIYIHIPFCRKKCAYCDFCSTSVYDEKTLDRYVQALITQFDDFFIKGGKYEADTVYVGGGTPSVNGLLSNTRKSRWKSIRKAVISGCSRRFAPQGSTEFLWGCSRLTRKN